VELYPNATAAFGYGAADGINWLVVSSIGGAEIKVVT
jgi:hypothetical protein